MLSKPNQWRVEWSHSPTLQEQFPSAESYAEHMARLERKKADPATSAAPMSEAERIAAIDELALPGHEALLAELKADTSIAVGQAAIQIATAEKARRAPAQAPATVVPFSKAATSTGPINLVALRRRSESEWEASADLQAEFATAEIFASYEVGIATGRVRNVRGPHDAA